MKIINALLSCPSDVFSNFYSDISKAIEDVNFYIEKLIDTHISIRHYLSSSYSQIGKPAQDHLDDTLIIDSDVCLAFYYHKLGTSTKNYRSGTDEEIHLMRNAGKHVSLFRIYDSRNDEESEKELDEYFKELSSFSMYKTIFGKENIFEVLRTDIINYLVSSFGVDLTMIAEPFDGIEFLKRIIRFDSKEKEIIALISEINKFTKRKNEFKQSAQMISDQTNEREEIKKLVDNQNYKKLAEVTGALSHFMKEPVPLEHVFDDASRGFLDRFVKKNELALEENFLSFHGETIYKNVMPLTGGGLELAGSPIKEKVEWLSKLADWLKNYYAWQEYFERLADVVFVPLAVSNNTTLHQKAINVKIHIKNDDYVPNAALSPKEEVALEMYALNLDTFFDPFRRYAGLERYGDASFSPEVTTPLLNNNITNYEATIDNWLDEMFNYGIERTNDEVILSVRFNGLNAEEKHCLPTYLVLKKTTESIYYEISGSGLPRKRSGKIEFKHG